jgi:hypothetical protein
LSFTHDEHALANRSKEKSNKLKAIKDGLSRVVALEAKYSE